MRTTAGIVIFILGLAMVVAFLQLLLGPDEEQDPATVEIDWNAVRHDPADTLSLRWLGPARYPSAKEGAWIERNLERAVNVDFDPLFLDHNSYLRRKPLMMAGGDVPDVIWESNSSILQADAHHGFLLEVPYNIIYKHAPNYVAKLNRISPASWVKTHYEGRNYGVPLYAINGIYPRPGLWREDWLEAVGMDIPETLEEFREAMRRFRYNDPDGDGLQNTYGTMPSVSGHLFLTRLFGIYHINPNMWTLEDGELVWGGIRPETKKALGWIREMHAEGVFHPDFLAVPQSNRVNITRQKFESGQIGYVDVFGAWMQINPHQKDNFSIAYTIRKLNPDAEVAPGRPLRHDGRVSKMPVSDGAPYALAFGRHLQRRPEKVVRVLRILDRLAADTRLHVQAMVGKRGVHWKYDPKAGVQFTDEYASKRKNHLLTNLDAWAGYFAPFSLTEEEIAPYLAEGEAEYLDTAQSPDLGLVSPLIGGSAVVPGLTELMAEPGNLQEKAFAEIVLGERPLEDFDWFVEEWRQRGGAEATELANRFFEKRDDILKQAGAWEAFQSSMN